MNYLDSILSRFDQIANPLLFEALNKFIPETPIITLPHRCNGHYTIFDQAARMAYREYNEPLSAVDIGSMSAGRASTVFEKLLIKQAHKLPAVIPLSRVESLSASKSTLSHYPTLYEFGKDNYSYYKDLLKTNNEQQIFDYCINGGLSEGGTCFDFQLWAPSLQWLNTGGSHRFATAFYIAAEQNYSYNIKGKITVYSLNHEWLDEIFQVFDVFLMTENYDNDILALYDAFDINNSSSLSTFVYLGLPTKVLSDFSCKEKKIILLLKYKEQRVPRFVNVWLKNHLYAQRILKFNDVIKVLKDIEQTASEALDPLIDAHSMCQI